MKKFLYFIFIIFFIINSFSINSSSIEELLIIKSEKFNDISINIEFFYIRALDDIDKSSDPDFKIIVYMNNIEFISDIWYNTKYIYNPDFSPNINIPSEDEFVNIKIQLWDYADEHDNDRLCDISGNKGISNDSFDVDLIYNTKTGHWTGDDFLYIDLEEYDPSGYGRLNGCDDGTIYDVDRDCEIWFDIYQDDIDGDKIPSWIETNVYNTDPMIDNTGEDLDNDDVPIEWEHKWGYDPLKSEDHKNFDFDNDSISNIEEFLTSEYGSNPFRKDLFLELDFMEDSPKGEISVIPDSTLELMKNPFHRRNIVFYIDNGKINGGETIPYQETINQTSLLNFYNNYFLNQENNEWIRGVFHYGIIVYKAFPAGYAFSGDVEPFWGYHKGTNCFVISSSRMERNDAFNIKNIDYFYASAIVHEMGHNFGLRAGNPPGVDVQLSKWPWQIGWWIYRDYESIMNYHYTYKILDYSDGSNGGRDFDDWSNLDFNYFEI
jgi:hypothetical protein